MWSQSDQKWASGKSAQDPAKEVKSGSQEVRYLITKTRPTELIKVGLGIASAEKNPGLKHTDVTEVRSLQSGFVGQQSRMWA